MLTSWRFSRMTPEQLARLGTPPAPKTGPAYDQRERQQIIRTIIDLWPEDEEDEDEYLEGLTRLGTWWISGGAPVLSVDLTMLRRVRPAEPQHRDFLVRVL